MIAPLAGYANESTMRNHKLFDSPVGINENVDYVVRMLTFPVSLSYPVVCHVSCHGL